MSFFSASRGLWKLSSSTEVSQGFSDDFAETFPNVSRLGPVETIVKIVRSLSEIITMTGDGVNDAVALNPALRGSSTGGAAREEKAEEED